MKLLSLCFLLLCLSFCSCGPTIVRAPELKENPPRVVALLPIRANEEIRRERLDYLQEALRRELRSSGFLLLDEASVSDLCGGETCPRRGELLSRFKVQGFVALTVESSYRANFLAGYLNTLHGTLRLLDPQGKELQSVEYTEREKGGLLFNSGQVLEGLRSTSDNFGDESFNRLADRFIKVVAAAVPAPKSSQDLSSYGVASLSEVTTLGLGEGRYRFCASGTSGARASLVLDRQKISLRETRPGSYCGTLLLSGLIRPTSKIYVELRSPYGALDRRELEARPFLLCDPGTLLRRGGSTLAYGCSSDLTEQAKSECQTQLALCQDSQLLVFSGESEEGPFQKRGVLSAPSWTDPEVPAGSDKRTYAVLAVSPQGSRTSVLTLVRKE